MATITITDETLLGEKRAWALDILDETIFLRELIRRRIYQEVTEYNARQSADTATGALFLPFEGDSVLSIILSKAFLLADDARITDPSITRQIRPS